MRHTDGTPAPLPSAAGFRFAIVVSRFNEGITGPLREGAVAALREAGAADRDIDVLDVPGAFELPQAAAGLLNEAGTEIEIIAEYQENKESRPAVGPSGQPADHS